MRGAVAAARTSARFSEARDQNFFDTLATAATATPRIDYLDVIITRWPPAERVYGSSQK